MNISNISQHFVLCESTADQLATESVICAAENKTRTILSEVVVLQNGQFTVSSCTSVPQSTDNATDTAVAYDDTFEPCSEAHYKFPLLPVSRKAMYVCMNYINSKYKLH